MWPLSSMPWVVNLTVFPLNAVNTASTADAHFVTQLLGFF